MCASNLSPAIDESERKRRFHLKNQVDQAEEEGRDLLAEMAARLNQQDVEARGRLKSITGHGATL
jgi:hypothetical protein